MHDHNAEGCTSTKSTKWKIRCDISLQKLLTEPGPSVEGPPINAIILAPDPGTQTPKRPAATLNAAPVHLDAR